MPSRRTAGRLHRNRQRCPLLRIETDRIQAQAGHLIRQQGKHTAFQHRLGGVYTRSIAQVDPLPHVIDMRRLIENQRNISLRDPRLAEQLGSGVLTRPVIVLEETVDHAGQIHVVAVNVASLLQAIHLRTDRRIRRTVVLQHVHLRRDVAQRHQVLDQLPHILAGVAGWRPPISRVVAVRTPSSIAVNCQVGVYALARSLILAYQHWLVRIAVEQPHGRSVTNANPILDGVKALVLRHRRRQVVVQYLEAHRRIL